MTVFGSTARQDGACAGSRRWGCPHSGADRRVPSSTAMSARAWTCFAAVATLWGIPYLFIKVAVDDGVPPAFVAWSRVTVGAVILLTLAWRAGLLDTLRGRGKWLVAYAVPEIVIPFPLIAARAQRVASSLAARLIAPVPLFIALLALRFGRDERAEGRRLV